MPKGFVREPEKYQLGDSPRQEPVFLDQFLVKHKLSRFMPSVRELLDAEDKGKFKAGIILSPLDERGIATDDARVALYNESTGQILYEVAGQNLTHTYIEGSARKGQKMYLRSEELQQVWDGVARTNPEGQMRTVHKES